MKIQHNSVTALLLGQSEEDHRAELEKFEIPTLLIFVRDDKPLKSPNGDFFNESMPNAKLVIIENRGHNPFIEETDKLNRLVVEFILENNC